MTPERWQQIDHLFHEALACAPELRNSFLAAACENDEALRREIESLISSHQGAEQFIETPAGDVAAELLGTRSSTFEPGQEIENYRIGRLLGRGGMGEVYLAEDIRLKRQVALKLLPAHFTVNPDRVRRFEREAQAASALNHPNIVTIYEIGKSSTTHFIATEFVDGKTLRQLINEQPFRLNESLNVAIQVASALAGAHAAGIVHRDIKPENIMIRTDGYVKILDFGLAKLTEQQVVSEVETETPTLLQSNPGLVMGTVQYMSPEQARGHRVDARTDIWSLGIVMYELLAGHVPFTGETPSHVMVSLMEDELRPLTGYANVPVEVDRIVTRALRKKQRERYQTANELSRDLKTLKEELQLEARLKGFLDAVPSSKTSLTGSLAAVPALQTGTKTDRSAPTAGTVDMGVAHQTSSGEYVVREIKRHKTLVATLAIVILLAGVIGLGNWITRDTRQQFKGTVLAAPFASEKLSTNGKVFHAIISPDGQNVVYTNKSSNDKDGIWLRQLETGNNLEIVAPSDSFYYGLALSPDGNFIYFVHRPRVDDGSQSALYRLPVGSGIPQKIISGDSGDVQGWISLSPDGRHISFVRCPYRGDEYCSLLIADAADGRNEKKLFSRPSPYRISDNEFSPDGKLIAFGTGQSNNEANDFGLWAVDVESGAQRELTAEKFFDIRGLTWLPDQQSLLITAPKIPSKNIPIWQVSAATGETVRLTKDAEMYSELSLDKSASRLVATKFKQNFRLRIFDFETASVGTVLEDAAKVSFAPDGKMFYTSTMMSDNDEVWSINADGSGQRQLTHDPADDGFPIVAPDNSAVYFTSNRTGAAHVWRMNPDGSNQTQVTRENGGFPILVTPDGEWLYFQHSMDRTLWRISTRSGEEQSVVKKSKHLFAINQDGSLVAFDGKIGGENFIVVTSLPDAQMVKTFKLANPTGKFTEIAWMPDGKNLAYVLADRDFGKYELWIQPFETAAKPRKITDLNDEQFSASQGFALSPDGKSFAVSQGNWLHDAVLLRGLR